MEPQYRLLTQEELQALEKEFVDYLIVNGITGKDWEQLKADSAEEAERIVALFSDVVFEGVMRKVQYLEYQGQKVFRAFQCLPDKLVMVSMEAPSESKADFTDAAYFRKAAQHPLEGIKVYTTQKNYPEPREKTLFKMTQEGCVVSDGKRFKSLCLVLPGTT